MEPRAAQAFDRLHPGVLKHLPRAVRAAIVREETSGQTSPAQTLRQTVDRQTFETTLARFGRDAWEAVARALDGNLNIAPEAIANKLQDERRQRRRREDRERPSQKLQDIQFRVIEDDTATTVARFWAERPDLHGHLALLLSPLSTKEKARQQKVSVQAIRDRMRRAAAEVRRALATPP